MQIVERWLRAWRPKETDWSATDTVVGADGKSRRVQPVVGHLSDHAGNVWAGAAAYFLTGALLASCALIGRESRQSA